MVALVRYIPKSTLWLCPMFLIGSDLITNLYGGDKARSTVTRRVHHKTKQLVSSRRHKSERNQSMGQKSGEGILHHIREFD
ncbi:LADA_0B03466g1_1 [Lachancea dasiensis]|uniref:LADA_0B03466g1_1 n=1 Tax=Lachancea dasiensis TaxID=1072105 RepID=A0A1G4ISP6_9SACH|nr:LADA_0B03466g1_1 [Lachancea dasiensis]